MSLLECLDVSFGYEGKEVLSEVSFALEGGEYLCIVGENGAGKSTLIKGMLGLLEPMSGSVVLSDELRGGTIGYLPQQTVVQKNFPASVYEVVISGRLNGLKRKVFFSDADKTAAMHNIKLMGLNGLEKRCCRDLSGGQQQRVLLARALCSAKKMIILDEPVAGLDPVATSDLYDLIQKINKDMLMTVIMVSHDIHAAVEYSSHILHLSNKQLFFGRTKDYVGSDVGRNYVGSAAVHLAEHHNSGVPHDSEKGE